MSITIREANECDYLAIGNLIKHELGYDDVNFSLLFDRLKKIRFDDNHMTYVAVMDEKIVGFIGVFKYITYEIDAEYLLVLAMAVSQKHQNQGIGSMLLRQAEQFAVDNNIFHVRLTSNLKRLDAHIFYERNDYVRKSYGFLKSLSE